MAFKKQSSSGSPAILRVQLPPLPQAMQQDAESQRWYEGMQVAVQTALEQVRAEAAANLANLKTGTSSKKQN